MKSHLGIYDGNRRSFRIDHNSNRNKLDNTRYAERIWKESVPYIDTPAWKYLVERGLSPFNTSALNFHSACPFKGQKVPTMIAAMVNAETNEFQGIHRTQLHPKDKAMLGPSTGAVVKLSCDESVLRGLHICEGIETGLALLNMGFSPVWSCLSAQGIAKFPVMSGIESLTIFADNDVHCVGENAAIECGQRWINANREVSIFKPAKLGSDFADREVV